MEDVVDASFQHKDALLVGLEAENEVLELVVRVALPGLDALQRITRRLSAMARAPSSRWVWKVPPSSPTLGNVASTSGRGPASSE